MENLLRKISGFVFSYHKSVVAVFAVLTLVSVLTIFRMQIRTDIIDVLPAGNETVAEFRDFMQRYGVMDHVTFVIEADGKPVDGYTDLIESLAEKLKLSGMIGDVDYTLVTSNSGALMKKFPMLLNDAGIRQLYERLTPSGIERQAVTNRQRLLSPMSSPVDSELISRDPLMISSIVRDSFSRVNKDNRLDISEGYYFTKDHTMAFVFAKPKGRSRDMAFVDDFKKEADAIIASVLKEGAPDSVRIRATGNHILSAEVKQVIRRDIASSTLISVIVIALLIKLVYRARVSVVLAIGFTMLASLSMTLAFAYLMFGSLNIVTSIVAAVLIGLYVDYSMHMSKRFGDELGKHNDRNAAMEITLTKTGAAIIVSAITTSLSFFSIVVTRFEGLYELGIVSGIGVLLCLLCNLLLFSSLLVWISSRGKREIPAAEAASPAAERWIELVTKRSRIVITSGIVLVILIGAGMTMLRFDTDPEHIGHSRSQAAEVLKLINRKMNMSGEPVAVRVRGRDLKELEHEFDSLESTLLQWKQEGVIGGYESPSMLLPPLNIQRARMEKMQGLFGQNKTSADELAEKLKIAMGKNGLTLDSSYVDTYAGNITAALTNRETVGFKDMEAFAGSRLERLYNSNDMSFAAYLYPPEGGWNRQSLETVRQTVKAKGASWNLIGRQVLFDEIKSSIITGSALATVITFALNLAVIIWYFRKPVHVLLALLPVTAGFIVTLGVMGLINSPFNFINVGTVALIFGFGVDYGIYVMQAYLKEDKKDIGNALRLTGKNVMMCAATTVAGCGSLVTAEFAGIASIGVVLTIGAVSCAFIALFMLPSLLHRLERY